MKHILYPIPVLLLMVFSLVFCQCSSRRGPYDPQLMHIDSLLNEADVDTAKVLAAFGRVGAPDKPCGVGRADANPKLLLNDT